MHIQVGGYLSSNMASWEIPELSRGRNGKIIWRSGCVPLQYLITGGARILGHPLIEGSLEVKLPAYGQMQQQWWENNQKTLKKRKSQTQERARRKKINVREKVEKAAKHSVFPMFCGSQTEGDRDRQKETEREIERERLRALTTFRSISSPCHQWITTTHPFYRFPILKLPPAPCAVLLV